MIACRMEIFFSFFKDILVWAKWKHATLISTLILIANKQLSYHCFAKFGRYACGWRCDRKFYQQYSSYSASQFCAQYKIKTLIEFLFAAPSLGQNRRHEIICLLLKSRFFNRLRKIPVSTQTFEKVEKILLVEIIFSAISLAAYKAFVCHVLFKNLGGNGNLLKSVRKPLL